MRRRSSPPCRESLRRARVTGVGAGAGGRRKCLAIFRRWTFAIALVVAGESGGLSEDAIQNALQDRWGAESEVVLDEVVLGDGAPESVEHLPSSTLGASHHEVVDDYVWDYSEPVQYTPDPSPPPSAEHVVVGASRPAPPPVAHVAVGESRLAAPPVEHVVMGSSAGSASYAVEPPAPPTAVEHVPVSHGGGHVAEPRRAVPQPVKFVRPPPPSVRHVVMDKPRPPPPPPPPPASYCIVARRENCTGEELEFLDMTKKSIGSDHETLLSEAKRLRAKIDNVKKSQRAWLGQRAHILDGLLAQLPPAPPKRRRGEEL